MPKILFFFCLMLLFSCKTNKNSVTEKSDCDTYGIVQDFTGEDGCGYLIVLENGDKLNPAEIVDPDFKLRTGQTVKFGYKKLKGMMGICMMEKSIIKVTCIEEVMDEENMPCPNTKNPFEIDWMNRVLDRYNPTKIVKYKFEKLWAYRFEGAGLNNLYDCRGNLLCEDYGAPNDECTLKYFQKLTNSKVIWEGEGIWD